MHGGELGDARELRAPPERVSDEAAEIGCRLQRPLRRVEAAEVMHEAVPPVVPVVVAGNREYRGFQPVVGLVEALSVVAHLAARVDDVAADDREQRPFALRAERSGDGVLAVVAFAGVAEQEEGRVVAVAATRDELHVVTVGGSPCARRLHPCRAGAVDRVVEDLGDDVVARRPQCLGPQPGERTRARGNIVRPRSGAGAVGPAGACLGLARRRMPADDVRRFASHRRAGSAAARGVGWRAARRPAVPRAGG